MADGMEARLLAVLQQQHATISTATQQTQEQLASLANRLTNLEGAAAHGNCPLDECCVTATLWCNTATLWCTLRHGSG